MQAMPPWLLRVLQALGVVWALPYTALGLLAGAVSMAAGAHAHMSARELAVVFHKVPWGPGGALTLGNVILHTGDTLDSPCVTYAHRAGQRQESPFFWQITSAHMSINTCCWARCSCRCISCSVG